MTTRILLVEDDEEISGLVAEHLEREGCEVQAALDGEEALAQLASREFDLVLLDLMLPKRSGMEVLRALRETSLVPVLILSAKDSDLDKALGLGLGADDYLSKPFSMIELTARVQAAIRRATRYAGAPAATPVSAPKALRHGELELDLDTYSVRIGERSAQLTAKEFQLLKLFLTYPSRVFTKEQIYQSIWEEDYYGNENVINVHVRRLREKIEEDPSSPVFIRTVWGIGYKLGERP
ncbi:response regulator transcription factor [Paenibacillus sp. B01]|uniref:response regulator transcription factor n=1 Tax=Paenibacillus sp. B01 TaxID=2660554 RepID=UPI00129C09BC|nr:response regulator transcription factor [Paenibacillus sp. B01]QGG54618.1 response regulator [Paenibacillus sp. B01]